MNSISKMSFILILSLFGQASYAGEDFRSEENEFISFAKQGNLAQLRKIDIKTIQSFAFATALYEAVESGSLRTVGYLLSSHEFLDFELDLALNLADGYGKIENLLIQHGAQFKRESLQDLEPTSFVSNALPYVVGTVVALFGFYVFSRYTAPVGPTVVPIVEPLPQPAAQEALREGNQNMIIIVRGPGAERFLAAMQNLDQVIEQIISALRIDALQQQIQDHMKQAIEARIDQIIQNMPTSAAAA